MAEKDLEECWRRIPGLIHELRDLYDSIVKKQLDLRELKRRQVVCLETLRELISRLKV
jgi:hypothetical protein